MMQKSTTFTTIFRVRKCHFHYISKKKKLKGSVKHPGKNTLRSGCIGKAMSSRY
jgi:hypothetical protein